METALLYRLLKVVIEIKKGMKYGYKETRTCFFCNQQGHLKSDCKSCRLLSVKAAAVEDSWLNCIVSSNKIKKVFDQNVLYIPQLDGGLISVRWVTQHNHQVTVEGDTCTFYSRQQIIAKAYSDGSLFRMKPVVISSTCIHQWHRRLGNVDIAAIKPVVKKQRIKRFKMTFCVQMTLFVKNEIKKNYLKLNFQPTSRRKKPLWLIHSDLCGPMQATTPSDNKYLLTLIDDYSRFKVVMFLKSKNEVSGIIQEYIALSTRFGKRIAAERKEFSISSPLAILRNKTE